MLAVSPLRIFCGFVTIIIPGLLTCTWHCALAVTPWFTQVKVYVAVGLLVGGMVMSAVLDPASAPLVAKPAPALAVALPQENAKPTYMPTSAIFGSHESCAVGVFPLVLPVAFGTHCHPVVQPLPVEETGFHAPLVHDAGSGCCGGCVHA